LAGFDPAEDSVPPAALDDRLDRYVYHRAEALAARVYKAYDDYELHVVLRALTDFCTIDLSSLYCDVRKDRLYCDAKTTPERRATQTVLYRCLRAVTIALAPICCFTAEEIWSHMPKLGSDLDSVHLMLMDHGKALTADSEGEAQEMARLLELRARVQKELEPFRAQKKASLDAHVTVTVPAADAALIGTLPQGWLADLFIVSQVTVKLGEPAVTVADAAGGRCERCWKWSQDTISGQLDARCQAAVAAQGNV
jgi:isoleucyl-tRNA synthetase